MPSAVAFGVDVIAGGTKARVACRCLKWALTISTSSTAAVVAHGRLMFARHPFSLCLTIRMLLVLEFATNVLREMATERFGPRELIIRRLRDIVIGIFLAVPELDRYALRVGVVFMTVDVR